MRALDTRSGGRLRYALAVAALIGASLTLAGCATATTSPGASAGTTVSGGAFTASTAAGASVQVPSSKPTVMLFFSVECGSCGPETALLAELQSKAPDSANFVVVDVATAETTANVIAFLADNNASAIAYASDTNASLIAAYQVTQLSTVVVVNPAGAVVFRGVDPSASQVRDAIATAGAP